MWNKKVWLALRNVLTDSSQAHELSIETTWAKYCQHIGLLM